MKTIIINTCPDCGGKLSNANGWLVCGQCGTRVMPGYAQPSTDTETQGE